METKRKKKHYVVWRGWRPGVYESMKEVQIHTQDYLEPLWTAFATKKLLSGHTVSGITSGKKVLKGIKASPCFKQAVMEYQQALKVAEELKERLSPHCYRCEIAGSVRRKKENVKDIEIVAVPKPYQLNLLESGIATIVNRFPKVRGELPCKWTQRRLPDGINLDLFMVDLDNFGYQFAIRTGSGDFSHNVLGKGWVKAGYKSIDGNLYREGQKILLPEEEDLFRLIGLDYVKPEDRI